MLLGTGFDCFPHRYGQGYQGYYQYPQYQYQVPDSSLDIDNVDNVDIEDIRAEKRRDRIRDRGQYLLLRMSIASVQCHDI